MQQKQGCVLSVPGRQRFANPHKYLGKLAAHRYFVTAPREDRLHAYRYVGNTYEYTVSKLYIKRIIAIDPLPHVFAVRSGSWLRFP